MQDANYVKAQDNLTSEGDIDLELGGTSSDYLSWTNKRIRNGFIRKVYIILTLQLLLTFAIVMIVNSIDSVRTYFQFHSWIFWFSLAVMIVTMIAIVCFPSARRQYPKNMLFLLLFTLAMTFMLCTTTVWVDTVSLGTAIGITVLTFAALSAFSLQTKINLTMLSMMIFALVVIWLFYGISMIWWHSYALYNAYAGIGATIFALYIIFDTQLFLSGKHMDVNPDEYIFVALTLYLDAINFFIYILMLMRNR